MLQRVFADLLAPGERVQTKVEHPKVGTACRAFWINREAAVIDHADRRDLVPDGEFSGDWAGVGRARNGHRAGTYQFCEQLTRQCRGRVVVVCIELELPAEHATGSVDLIDRKLSAVDYGNACRPIGARRSGNQSD